MISKKAYERIMNVVRESIQPFFNELETGLHQKLAELEQLCGQIIDVQDKKIAELQCIVEKQGKKIEDLRKIVDNAEFWIQKLDLNPEIVALRKSVQEKDREIAELMEKEAVKIKKLMDNIAVLNETIKDLQDFKSKFMDFKSRFNCSRFNSFWPWR